MNLKVDNHRMRGFTLTELLITTTLASAVIAGSGKALVGIQQQARVIEQIADMNNTGQHALRLISSELRQAGYFGEATGLALDQIDGATEPTGSCVAADWGRLVATPISASNDTLEHAAFEDTPCVTRSNYLRGDVLTVRYANAIGPTTLNNTTNSQRLFLVPTPAQTFVRPGSNAYGAALATNPWRAYELVARSYFVGRALDSSLDADCTASAAPALMRMTLDARGLPVREEMLRNVEHLQFALGVDEDADGAADAYVDPDLVVADASVVAARVWILVRSRCPDPSHTEQHTYSLGDRRYAPSDHFRRQLYSATIALRYQSEQWTP